MRERRILTDYFVRDQRWTPLIVKEFGSGKADMGYVGYGFAMTDTLLEDILRELKCEARGESEDCELWRAVSALGKGMIWPPLWCIEDGVGGGCTEEDEEELRRRINDKAVALVREMEQ